MAMIKVPWNGQGRKPSVITAPPAGNRCSEALNGAKPVKHQWLMHWTVLSDKNQSALVFTNFADAIFYRGKVEPAGYFCRNILTNVFSRHTSFKLQDTSAIDIPEEAFQIKESVKKKGENH
jgi:hypothetical protein